VHFVETIKNFFLFFSRFFVVVVLLFICFLFMSSTIWRNTIVYIISFMCCLYIHTQWSYIHDVICECQKKPRIENIGVKGYNHRLSASYIQTLSHTVVSSTHRHERGSNSQL
jgi:hypothetical protein